MNAALEALHGAGLVGLAVEPLAVRLGATKGSFYWHFRDREELVAATLAAWEREETEQVIAALADAPGPGERLQLLAGTTMAPDGRPDLSVTLIADAGHPLVAEVLERVTRRRARYIAEQFETLGLSADDARARALLAYAAFLGHTQLRRWLPPVVEAVDPTAYLRLLEHALLRDLRPS